MGLMGLTRLMGLISPISPISPISIVSLRLAYLRVSTPDFRPTLWPAAGWQALQKIPPGLLTGLSAAHYAGIVLIMGSTLDPAMPRTPAFLTHCTAVLLA